MKLSVVIPTYSCPALLQGTLEALSNQTISKSEFEVIICDDGSTCDNQAIVAMFSHKLNVQYLWQEDRGFRAGEARNKGVEQSCSPLILFLDSGVLPHQQALEHHIQIHNTHQNRVIIGYVYGYMSDYLDQAWGIKSSADLSDFVISPYNVANTIRALKFNLIMDVREGRYLRYGDRIQEWEVPYDIFWTCHVSMTKRTFQQAGGFNTRFNEWGGEDFELGVRLHQQGVQWSLNRECCSIHLPHKHEVKNEQAKKQRIRKCIASVVEEHANTELDWYRKALDVQSDHIDVNGFAMSSKIRQLKKQDLGECA
ncbi:glycosyltransferase [Photobacterium minamisatsumaniensis]|uniref:glycosyltransferase n=1 Tax=Photobacterium minamisatsumaniensis TaxID=2910233 RepID=UPI003D0B2A22